MLEIDGLQLAVADGFAVELRHQIAFAQGLASELDILRHDAMAELPRRINAQHFFDLLGCDLDVLDVARIRGNEIISDLNYPIDRNIFGEYEIVVDSGTCEHVFNAGQAVINLASLVRQDGFIVQAAPLNGYNHGFYNFSPTIFYDFYSEQSGYRLIFLKGIRSNSDSRLCSLASGCVSTPYTILSAGNSRYVPKTRSHIENIFP